MKALALVVVFLVGRFLTAGSEPEMRGEQPQHPYVILDQHVRNVLAKDWDAHANDPAERERGYCITFQKDVWVSAEWVYRIVEVERAKAETGVTPHSVNFVCPFDDPNVTGLHVHPFASCISDWDCVRGGSLSGQCFASPIDEESVRALRKPFAVIQCARDAFVAVYP